MLKDRRKQWQKDCINYSWSRCGTVATERGYSTPTRLKRVNEMLKSNEHQASIVWENLELIERHKEAA
jgi:hypothetical protein